MHKIFSLVVFTFLVTKLFAQENITFQKPSASILTLADYERAPSISMDSKKEYMLLSYRNTYKSLEELNTEEMKLGGLRINPKTNISSSVTYITKLALRNIKTNTDVPLIGMPEKTKIAFVAWAPDESKIAFTNTTNNGVMLYVIAVKTGVVTKLSDDNLNANLGSPYTWLPNSNSLLVKVLPNNKPTLLDTKKDLPTGPTVSVAEGKKSQNRTYQDLLKNKTDETNFEILTTSELYITNIDGSNKKYKNAGMYVGESASPDGNFLMLTTLEKPFSYIVPYSRFPQTSAVYDMAGNSIKTVNEVPLNEIVPKGFSSVRKGKRNMAWRNDKPASLYYVEALDGGDQANAAEYRDEIYNWDAPFTTNASSILKTKQRFAGIIWGNDKNAIAYDDWYDTRNMKTYLFNPNNNTVAPKIIMDRNSQDIYTDPGSFETKKNNYNKQVLLIDKNIMVLNGDGFTKDGQFPFIDEYDFVKNKTTRIYTSKIPGKKEDLVDIEDYKKGEIMVMLQSKNEYPNYYKRNLKTNALTQVTFNINPFESIKNVYKEVIKYKRNDGVELSGTLYLPANYDRTAKTEKLPLLIWAYPAEFKDKNSAGQNDKNENEFTFPSYGSFIYYVTKGYAVLDDASFPIIGEGTTEPNDNFIPQLVANAEAAINVVDQLGYINKNKVGVGGHSYGAFMTANLLTHSKLFACGIARSGAYNRTLTPFGFQSEQRNFWDVPAIYSGMSPFNTADKMKTPLLLVHGDADNNPGTFTLQSERYFQALKGLGAPARLVLLPKEAHGYAAKENILHLLWEQEQFLDKWLK
jgi:dipeptidyl aminopeptidase/acylaminoacyl peptidase